MIFLILYGLASQPTSQAVPVEEKKATTYTVVPQREQYINQVAYTQNTTAFDGAGAGGGDDDNDYINC